MSEKIKVIVVDDSSLMRQAITSIFRKDTDVEVVGEASDGKQALSMIEELDPDIVTLDVNMPEMDGLTTLKHLMVLNPKPVIMLSSLTSEGADVTFDALRYGAVDFVAKPSKEHGEFNEAKDVLLSKVKAAAEVKVEAVRYIRVPDNNQSSQSHPDPCHQVVVIGAAEGGYGSLLKVIPTLQDDLSSAYLVVLYAEREHTEAFAAYLDSISELRVKPAIDGEPVEAGVCYIASGNDYMTLLKDNYEVLLHVQSAPFDFRKGSIDRAMFSAVETYGSNVLGIILSGKGGDGVEGLAEVLHNGGVAIVQNPTSCLYKEMPVQAIEHCSPVNIVSDVKISSIINEVFPGSDHLEEFVMNTNVENA